MNVNEEIIKIFRAAAKSEDTTKSSGVRLPGHIDFLYEEGKLTLSLRREDVLNINMQEDNAAFEGWAIVIKALWDSYRDDKLRAVSIDVPELPDPEKVFIDKEADGISAGTYGRFLYRADKFSKEFDWFELPENIQDCVNKYLSLLNKNQCTNVVPKQEAGINEKDEIQVECSFSKNPEELRALCDGEISSNVYRQLPCRLQSNDKKYHFLTKGAKSAMDLWNLSDNTLNIFELKAVTKKSKNKKVGIISELFFYVEYCKDMFVEPSKTFEPRPASGKYARGYDILFNAQSNKQIRKVRGFFLTNEYHPLMRNKAREKVKKVLDENNSHIEFIMLPEYDLDHMLSLEKKSGQSQSE